MDAPLNQTDMKIRKLFFKDLGGLRFIGLMGIFIYIITYILTIQKTSELSKEYLLAAAALKNISISIFFIVSSFLLSAHALREYKYTSNFSLRNFYIRRVIRIFPSFIIVVLFYLIIHPFIVNLLNLTELSNENPFYVLFFFPESHQRLTSEVFIYLFFIYGILVMLQYYLLWGLVLKYLKGYFNLVAVALVILGILFKIVGSSHDFAGYLYLPFYFYEIGLGALIASLIRSDSKIISSFKSLSGSTIAGTYIFCIITSVITFFFIDDFYINLIVKLLICAIIGLVIVEQTFSKHSPIKFRNSQFIIQMGKLSYNFIIFAPVFSVVVLIAFESIEINLNSGIALLLYPIVCFTLTWFISYFFNTFIDGFFNQIRKEFRAI